MDRVGCDKTQEIIPNNCHSGSIQMCVGVSLQEVRLMGSRHKLTARIEPLSSSKTHRITCSNPGDNVHTRGILAKRIQKRLCLIKSHGIKTVNKTRETHLKQNCLVHIASPSKQNLASPCSQQHNPSVKASASAQRASKTSKVLQMCGWSKSCSFSTWEDKR